MSLMSSLSLLPASLGGPIDAEESPSAAGTGAMVLDLALLHAVDEEVRWLEEQATRLETARAALAATERGAGDEAGAALHEAIEACRARLATCAAIAGALG
jgi:hypothetical protein